MEFVGHVYGVETLLERYCALLYERAHELK